MAPALSPVRKSSKVLEKMPTSGGFKEEKIQADNNDGTKAKDLVLKLAEKKKIKKIEEEPDTDDEGNFANRVPVTGKKFCQRSF